MKKTKLNILLIIFPLFLIMLFIIFIFSLPATYGIFKWNEYYKNLLIKICLIPLLLSFIAIIALLVKNKKNIFKILLNILIILNSIFLIIIITTTAFIIINSNQSFSEIKPIIMILDSTGSFGITDIGISFKTIDKQNIILNYYIENDLNNKTTLKDNNKHDYHFFIIKDLKPDTSYIFETSNGFKFKYKTPKAEISENSPFTFSVSSDPHFGREESRNDITKLIIDKIQKDNLNSFLAVLGDFVESGYIKSHWQKANEFLSQNLNSIPIIPVMGNHDAFVGGHHLYLKLFSPIKTENTKSPFYKHYHFKLQNKDIHLISLSLLWGIEDFSFKQRKFLIDELKKTKKDDFVVILSHAFFYASGYTEEGGIPWYDNLSVIKTIEPLLIQYDVDLVLSGHNHTMELIKNDNIYYGIIGAFGGKPDPEKTFTSKGSLWYQSGKYGYIKVKSYQNYFLITFYDENDNILYETKCEY